MVLFECDYGEGCQPRILQMLADTNMEQTIGYGVDPHCDRARELILAACGNPDADVHFLVGGTQTNFTVIAASLKPWLGVVSAGTGHINMHETGAVEATGHKVLTLPSDDGKLTAAQVDEYISGCRADQDYEHIVQPGMVYISHPTESGTIYSKAELAAIREVCSKHDVYLYLDGARLGYGLTSPGTDVTLGDIASLCDVFYIGGTKVGALFGEAVVIVNDSLKKDFRCAIKQHGGMLAKGRLLGIQFEALFEDDLYLTSARKAVEQAMRIRAAFEANGFPMLFDSPTNQQYPILPDDKLRVLEKKYVGCPWRKISPTVTAVRFCTSWATRDEDVDALVADIAKLNA